MGPGDRARTLSVSPAEGRGSRKVDAQCPRQRPSLVCRSHCSLWQELPHHPELHKRRQRQRGQHSCLRVFLQPFRVLQHPQYLQCELFSGPWVPVHVFVAISMDCPCPSSTTSCLHLNSKIVRGRLVYFCAHLSRTVAPHQSTAPARSTGVFLDAGLIPAHAMQLQQKPTTHLRLECNRLGSCHLGC